MHYDIIAYIIIGIAFIALVRFLYKALAHPHSSSPCSSCQEACPHRGNAEADKNCKGKKEIRDK